MAGVFSSSPGSKRAHEDQTSEDEEPIDEDACSTTSDDEELDWSILGERIGA